MRIVTYDLEKNENDMPMLVKESSQNYPSISNSITDPGEAVAVLNQALQLDRKMEEHFCLIAMRSKKVIGIFKVNVGTINNSLVNTAGIFTRLLLCGATHFIIAHNHPSGNVSPSPEDEKVKQGSIIDYMEFYKSQTFKDWQKNVEKDIRKKCHFFTDKSMLSKIIH